MKRIIALLFALTLTLPVAALAQEVPEKFLGAPVIPGGKLVTQEKTRLEILVPQTHDEILAYYKEALKGWEDVKFRNWARSTYIEDDSNRQWHSITIVKNTGNETSVQIAQDSWSWIIGTLVLRYVGVFVVLLILYLCMNISGGIISRSVKKSAPAKA